MEASKPGGITQRKGIFIKHQTRIALDMLTDEEYGKLVRQIDDYAFGGTVPKFSSRFEASMFNMLKDYDDYDENHYREIIEKRRVAGKKGAEARWNKAV